MPKTCYSSSSYCYYNSSSYYYFDTAFVPLSLVSSTREISFAHIGQIVSSFFVCDGWSMKNGVGMTLDVFLDSGRPPPPVATYYLVGSCRDDAVALVIERNSNTHNHNDHHRTGKDCLERSILIIMVNEDHDERCCWMIRGSNHSLFPYVHDNQLHSHSQYHHHV